MPATQSLPSSVDRFTVPRNSTHTIDRPQLYDQLDKGALGLLTVVSGPTGTGKTDLLISWLNQLESAPPVRWIAAAGFGSDIAAAIGAASIREVVDDDPSLTVVLDDFPGASAQFAADLLTLARNTTNLRIVITARRSLSTELLALRLAGQLYEIDAAQLGFGPDEIRRLAVLEGAELDSDQIQELYAASEGWPAAVRFAVQEVAHTGRARIWPAALETYVRTGILPTIEPDELSFLRNTCALERLHPAASALLPAPDGLDRCRAAGLLVRAGTDGHRQHRLIREVLLRDEIARRPEQVTSWYRRLAGHYRSADPVQALRYACRAGDSELIVDVCRAHWFAVAQSPQDVLDAFAQLPDARWRDDPELLLAFAAAHRAIPGHEHCASSLVHAAEEAAQRTADSTVRTVALIATGRQLAHLNSGDHGHAVSARTAVATRLHAMSPDEAMADADAIAFFHASCGLVEVVLGEFRAAGEAFQAGRTAATVSRNAPAQLLCIGGQLLLDALTGHLDRVEQQLPELRRQADELRLTTGLAIGAAEIGAGLAAMERQQAAPAEEHFARARRSTAPLGQLWPLLAYGQATVLMDQERLATGLDVIRAAIAEFDQSQCSPFGFALLVKAEAELLLKFDQPAAARDTLELVDTSEDPIVGLATTRARIAMHEGNPSTACELLQHWLTNAKRRITSVHIDAFATHAVAALLCGRKVDASRSFQQATAMADRTGCRRPLSLIPRPFVPLLAGESAEASADCSLTPRERVVLGHIGRDATIREIASQLSVSQNTLKTQLRGLYRKLGARSRNEALSRARSLSLL